MEKGAILLCAGGTGGHLFPAEALAHELMARGHRVHLATDGRAERFATGFPAAEIHVVRSATFGSKSPLARAKSAWTLFGGYLQSRKILRRLKPNAVVGFGGYPTVPPVLAAIHMKIPTLIHDANAVMGRANRWLAPRVRLVAMGFEGAQGQGGAIVTGNPVRPGVLAAASVPYPLRNVDEPFQLLVFGGSQGAQFFSQVLPQAIGRLDRRRRDLVRIVQQARPEDLDALAGQYGELGVQTNLAPFFSDMAEHLANAHFVICRAGASTVSELAVIGRPAVLAPYPHALDHDQALNAKAMAQTGGAEIVFQSHLSGEWLAARIAKAMDDPQALALLAEKAKTSGKPDAARCLADCVEHVAGGGTGADFKRT